MTAIEFVALVCFIVGFAAGGLCAMFFYAHAMASHTSL